MITATLNWLERLFASIPLPLFEVWGRFGYLLGLVLMVLAYGNISLSIDRGWALGRQKQVWDARAFQSMIITFVAIFVTGYIGSSIVLVPGAQTFESLKDLSVFLCLVLFGYPALLVVPFAYGLSDIIEGVPPLFLMDWLPGYFINPSCFWLAYQLIGRDPNFLKRLTWGRYAVFVLIFMCIEPQLWGYLCSEQFTSAISYRSITPALFFTTLLTWILGPFAMMVALPLARRKGFFWAEIPGHVIHNSFKDRPGKREGVPLRIALLLPFIILLLTMVGSTAYVSLKNAETNAERMAHDLNQSVTLSLMDHLNNLKDSSVADEVEKLTQAYPGEVILLDQKGEPVGGNLGLAKIAADWLLKEFGTMDRIREKQSFSFPVISSKPLSYETWIALFTPFILSSDERPYFLVAAIPAAYYKQGVMIGNSQSAMVIAIALLLSLIGATVLSSFLTKPVARIAWASQAMAQGDLNQTVPPGKLSELRALTDAFNHMSSQLQDSFHRTKVSEEKFRDLVETTPGIVWVVNPDSFRILFMSPQVESLLGYAINECQREGFWLMQIDPVDREHALAFYTRRPSPRDTSAIEYRFRCKSGTIVWLRDTVKYTHVSKDERNFYGVIIDISDRKLAEQALEIVNVKSDTALELAKAGYWHVPLNDSRLFNSSQRTVEILGDRPKSDYIYRISEDWLANITIVDETAGVEAMDALQRVLNGDFNIYDTVYPYRRPVDGRVIWIRALGKLVRDQQGKATDLYGVVQDITEFKTAQDEVREMNARLEERVMERTEKLIQATKNLMDSSRKAGMAEVAIGVLHNIGNALTSASIRVQNLNLDYQNDVTHIHLQELISFLQSKGDQLGDYIRLDPKGKKVVQYLEAVCQEVFRRSDDQRHLVTQLLKDLHLMSQLISKQQSNAKFTGVVENFSLVECVEDVLALQAYECERYRISVKRDYRHKPKLSTDRYKLVQILSNLVNNAMQALHPNAATRQLTVRIEELHDEISIEVQDNGVGISPEQMGQIFRYGYTTRKAGHGFGLHTSYMDAQLLGGQLSCKSDGPGHGASFTLVLPKFSKVVHDDFYSAHLDLA